MEEKWCKKILEHAQRRRKLHTHTHTHTHGCLCKTIIPAIFLIATTIPTFATNIDDTNKGCTSGNLTTSSGTAALEADWRANTVGVTFYNGDNQFDTASCTYDGTLTLPENDPTKTGYTFNGWKVRRAAATPAPEPITYTACSQIQDETICGQYDQCVWNNGTCYLTHCDEAPSESWCEESFYSANGWDGGDSCGMNDCGECSAFPRDPC